MEEKDAITWTSIMQAFPNHDYGYHALQGFAQMVKHITAPFTGQTGRLTEIG
jgi:hypothetical protein